MPRTLTHALHAGASPQQLYHKLVDEGWPPEIALATLQHALQSLPGRVVLRATGLVKRFGPRTVLNDISFDIQAGQVLGIIGPSGVGKTTLLTLLAGWQAPDRGTVEFFADKSVHVHEQPLFVRRLFGFAAQRPSLYPKLTALENILHFAALHGVLPDEQHSRAQRLLDLIGLREQANMFAEQLSGGQQKRLDIACALVHQPQVLFLDEPVADLDPDSRERVWSLMRALAQQGVAVVLATHFLSELEKTCDEVIALQHSRIVAQGTPEEIVRQHHLSSLVVIRTAKAEYPQLLRMLKGVTLVHSTESTLLLRSSAPHELAAQLPVALSKINDRLVELQIQPPGLNEVFAHLSRAHRG